MEGRRIRGAIDTQDTLMVIPLLSSVIEGERDDRMRQNSSTISVLSPSARGGRRRTKREETAVVCVKRRWS